MKKWLMGLLCVASVYTAQAQYLEGGIYAGVAHFNGDHSTRAVEYLTLQPTVGGFLRWNANDDVALRLSAGWGRVALDMANTNPNYQHYEIFLEHNLKFRTDIAEVSAVAEWNILGFDPYNLRKTFSPYVYAGFTAFYYNPKAPYQGDWVALRPLGTEGQGMDGYGDPYGRFSVAIPVGIGVKWAINDLWNVGIDWGSRATFTDYLDDASNAYVSRPELVAGNGELAANLANRMGEYLGTEPVVVPTGTRRANPDSNDFYAFITVTFSYNFLDNGLVGYRRRNIRRTGCPTNF